MDSYDRLFSYSIDKLKELQIAEGHIFSFRKKRSVPSNPPLNIHLGKLISIDTFLNKKAIPTHPTTDTASVDILTSPRAQVLRFKR